MRTPFRHSYHGYYQHHPRPHSHRASTTILHPNFNAQLDSFTKILAKPVDSDLPHPLRLLDCKSRAPRYWDRLDVEV